MRKSVILSITFLIAIVASSPNTWAKKRSRKRKMARSEKKARSDWQQKKHDLTPAQLKVIIEENHQLKASQEALETQAASDKEELAQLRQLQEKINALRKERGLAESDDNTDLENLFKQQQPDINQDVELGGFGKDDWAVDENGKYYLKGISFKVQIGAYKNHDLSQVLEDSSPEAFEQENIEGMHIFTIRHFKDYWKANEFKKEVRALGIKDAYIVCFSDGKRVSLKSVLPQVRSQKQ